MNKPDGILDPTLIGYCKQCSFAEAKAVLASCCYIVFRDRSVARRELDTVNSIADQLGMTSSETARIAGKVRRGKIKLKKPKSNAARNLLFHLALRTAIADQTIDHREREAIDHLARQLKIPDETVERELNELRISSASAFEADRQTSGAIGNLSESLSRNWCCSQEASSNAEKNPRQHRA